MVTGRPTIAGAALELIEANGPMTLVELTPALVAAGRTRAKNPEAAVAAAIRYNSSFLEHPDGRFFSLPAQLEGAVFAVRPTRLERDEEVILVRDELALVEMLLRRRHWGAHGDDAHIDFFADYFDLPWPHHDIGDDEDEDDGWPGGDVDAPSATAAVVTDEGAEVLTDFDDADGAEEAAMALREMLGEETTAQFLDLLAELGVPPGNEDRDLVDFVWEMGPARVIHGPRGWLPTIAPGQLVGLMVVRGGLRAVPLSRHDVRGRHVSEAVGAFGSLARMLLGPQPLAGAGAGAAIGVPLEELLEFAAMEAPEILRAPLPPLRDVLRRSGLEAADGLVTYWLGPAGGLRLLDREVADGDPGDAPRSRLH